MSFSNHVPQVPADSSAVEITRLGQQFCSEIGPRISNFPEQKVDFRSKDIITRNDENLPQNSIGNSAIRKKSHEKLRHCAFSPEEDANLRKLISQHGENDWMTVSLSMARRSARQCRERWLVLKKREESKRPWSHEEDNLLVQKCIELGPKWAKIEKFFIGRDVISIKSRWKLLTSNAEIDSLMMSEQNHPKTDEKHLFVLSRQIEHNQELKKSENNYNSQQSTNNFVNPGNNQIVNSSYENYSGPDGFDYAFWDFLNFNNDDNSDDLFGFASKDDSVLNNFW